MSLSVRLSGLLAVALVAFVAVLGLSGVAGASAGTTECDPPPGPRVVNAAHTTVAADPSACAGDDADAGTAAGTEAVGWAYQVISTDRSESPYVGSPQQQWLVAGGIAAVLALGALVRRQLRGVQR